MNLFFCLLITRMYCSFCTIMCPSLGQPFYFLTYLHGLPYFASFLSSALSCRMSSLFAFVFAPAHLSKVTYSHIGTTAWGLVEVMHPAVNAFDLTVNGLTWTTQRPWFWIPEFVLQQMCYFTLTHSHAHSKLPIFPLCLSTSLVSFHVLAFFSLFILVQSCFYLPLYHRYYFPRCLLFYSLPLICFECISMQYSHFKLRVMVLKIINTLN